MPVLNPGLMKPCALELALLDLVPQLVKEPRL